jgi:hypothetical protein
MRWISFILYHPRCLLVHIPVDRSTLALSSSSTWTRFNLDARLDQPETTVANASKHPAATCHAWWGSGKLPMVRVLHR